jgi:hypothetical protein
LQRSKVPTFKVQEIGSFGPALTTENIFSISILSRRGHQRWPTTTWEPVRSEPFSATSAEAYQLPLKRVVPRTSNPVAINEFTGEGREGESS